MATQCCSKTFDFFFLFLFFVDSIWQDDMTFICLVRYLTMLSVALTI